MANPTRILYALGPGDVVDSYRKLSAGLDVLSETSLTFSGQFFDFCRDHGVQGYALSSHPSREIVRDGPFIVENRPKPLRNPRGILFHLNRIWYGLSIIATALRYGARIVVVDSGTTYDFILALLAPLRIKIILCLHNARWPTGYPPTGRVKRAILALDGWAWRTCSDAILCVSPECRRQVEMLVLGKNRRIFEFRAQFRRAEFSSIPPPPPHDRRPLTVLFAGRVFRNKGVFDLLTIAEYLEQEFPGQLRYEICGDGGDLEELTHAIRKRRLGEIVHPLGRLNRPEMLAAYGRSHLVIVPTRSGFSEGMPMVAAEAILAGRPVITSRLSNALDVLGDAIVEAQPDDPRSYAEGIRRVLTDRDNYLGLCRSCPSVQQQFYDRTNGWAAAFERAVRSIDATLLLEPSTCARG